MDEKTKQFINRAKKIHGSRYSYDRSVYTGADNKICITCEKHGDFLIRAANHLIGQGCPKCAGRGLSQEEVIERFRDVHGDKYDYSKVVFTKMHDKVCIICPKHGEFWQTPAKHTTHKQGCPKCGSEKKNKNRHITIDEFIKRSNEIHSEKYDYTDVYFENLHDKVTIICPIHGKFEQFAYDHLNGHGCPTCGKLVSKSETELYDYVCGLVGEENVERNNRSLLGNREIDIYIPSFKIGIEYNGVLWHSEKYGKDRYYHLDKLERCKKLGVTLIQVFEDEYLNKNELVLEKIRYILKKCEYETKINARECYIDIIDTKRAKEFLEQNHIQGFGKSTIYLGLYTKQTELVAVMSFRCLFNKSDKWELTRFCVKNNVLVRGAGGKLFKYFVSEYNPKYIKSFADRRWTNDEKNNLYTKLDFSLTEVTKPDYRYIVENKPDRIHKFNFRKKILNRKYNLPLTMTESEMCEQIGAYKVWDCGLYRYEWYNNKQ